MTISHITRRHPEGRYGVGVSQGRIGPNYPLVNPSPDVKHLLAELVICVNRTWLLQPPPPLAITSLTGFGAGPAVGMIPTTRVRDKDIALGYVGGSTFLSTASLNETACIYSERDLNDRISIVQWTIPDYFDITLLYHTAWNNELEPAPREYSRHFSPAYAVIDPRCVAVLSPPARLFFAGEKQDHSILTEGSNITLEVEPSTNTILVAAAAGQGSGRYKNCEENVDVSIKTINDVKPSPTGDFKIQTDSCLSVTDEYYCYIPEGELETVCVTRFIVLGNHCKPCCSCVDYQESIDNLEETAVAYRMLGLKSENLATRLRKPMRLFELNALLLRDKPLTLTLVPQACPYVDVGFTYTNRTEQRQTSIRVELTSDPPEMTLVGGFTRTEVSGQSSSGSPVNASVEQDTITGAIEVLVSSLDPDESVWLVFRLRAACGTYTEALTGIVVSAEMWATGRVTMSGYPLLTQAGQPVEDRKRVKLRCAEDTTDITLYEDDYTCDGD